jgi:regulator of sigma E protease
MLTGIILFIGISLLVLVHELGHFIAAKQAGIKVEEFGFGFPPRIKAWKRGETEYSINWLPIGGFVRIYGENQYKAELVSQESGEPINHARAFFKQSAWRRFVVIAAGISINFIAGWLLLSAVYAIGDRTRVEITELQAGSPAEAIQLQVGDELLDYKTAEDFVAFTKMHRGQEITLNLERAGESLVKKVTLRTSPQAGEGALGAAVSDFGFKRLPVHRALFKGAQDSVAMVAEIFRALGDLVRQLFGHAQLPGNIVGPVGIFSMAGEFGRLGFVYVLQVIAMISLNLAALNALPFPALDGGRILFLMIEKIKGSPITPKRELIANAISFGFLIILMLVITGRDIVRLF